LNSEIQAADQRFLDLVNGNRPKILKICRVYAWNRDDQDDLYQEILFQIWRGLPSLREDSFSNTWLYRTARQAVTVQCDPDQIRELADTSETPDLEPAAQLAALYDAIAKLDDVEKALITLFLEDLTYEQIAEVMGLSGNHVGVLLHRVKKKLSALTKETVS
jgi:RNA polymerase sigma-70 factor, ECF subfamily